MFRLVKKQRIIPGLKAYKQGDLKHFFSTKLILSGLNLSAHGCVQCKENTQRMKSKLHVLFTVVMKKSFCISFHLKENICKDGAA